MRIEKMFAFGIFSSLFRAPQFRCHENYAKCYPRWPIC